MATRPKVTLEYLRRLIDDITLAGPVPSARTITINGSTQDLSANRTYTVTDANLSTTDITTNNSSTTKHGFLKKLSNVATEYMDGQGNWSTPPGGNTNLAIGTITGTTVQITSDTGTDATIPAATTTDAGLLIATDKVKLNNTTNTNSGDETATTLGATINAAGAATPNNTDFVATAESGGLLKKITWTNAKAFLKTYFDGLYPSGSGTSTGTNTGDQTTVSGNAGTATTLQTARKIHGVSFNGSADIQVDPFIEIMKFFNSGSTTKAIHWLGIPNDGTGTTMVDQTLYLQTVYVPEGATLSGVEWSMITTGNYTANNYNGIGLYTTSGGVLTLVASSTNDGNIWKGSTTVLNKKLFTTALTGSAAGVYIVAALYCRSAVTTAPVIQCFSTVLRDTINSFGSFSVEKNSASKTGQTSFPASVNYNTFNHSAAPIWFSLY